MASTGVGSAQQLTDVRLAFVPGTQMKRMACGIDALHMMHFFVLQVVMFAGCVLEGGARLFLRAILSLMPWAV